MPPMCNSEPPLFAVEWKGKLGGKKKNAAANAEQLHVYIPHCPEQNSSFYFGEKAIAFLPGYGGSAHVMFTHRLWQVYPEQLFEASALPTSTGRVTLFTSRGESIEQSPGLSRCQAGGWGWGGTDCWHILFFRVAFPIAEGWNGSQPAFVDSPSQCAASLQPPGRSCWPAGTALPYVKRNSVAAYTAGFGLRCGLLLQCTY